MVFIMITALSKCVLSVEARCPPAEKPMTPIFAGSICHWTACCRTICSARWASCQGTDGFIHHNGIVRQAIFYNEGRDANFIKFLRYGPSFVASGQINIASPGKDDHGSAGRFTIFRKVWCNRWNGHLAYNVALFLLNIGCRRSF